ncbi:hypothetical protein ACIBQX_18725 [Nonomuraea sp. NPDC049714]|uniref:hypothetical protein n=1 Tax=Nonomuraea sp. NPDC049714 TaxID=3364357 RepID=UPI0037B400DD
MARRSYTSRRGDQPTAALRPFDLDGVTFTPQGNVSMMDVSEFARLASQGLDSQSPEAVGFLADVYRSLLGDQYAAFREHCRKHGTDGAVLVEILGDMVAGAVEEETGRPTVRSSDSSDGPPPAPATQTVVSFSKHTVETQPVEETPQLVSYG